MRLAATEEVQKKTARITRKKADERITETAVLEKVTRAFRPAHGKDEHRMVLHTTPGTALAIQPGPPLSPAPASSWGVSHKSASVPAFPYDGLIYIPLKTKNKYKLCFHIFARCFNKAPFQSFLAVPPKNQGRNEMQSTALPCALFAWMPPTQKQNERHGNPGAPMSCSGRPPVAQ